MLSRRRPARRLLSRGSAILAVLGCAASLAVLPGTAAADSIRDNQ